MCGCGKQEVQKDIDIDYKLRGGTAELKEETMEVGENKQEKKESVHCVLFQMWSTFC